MPLNGKPLLYTISLLTALSFLMIGYDNGVIGGLTGSPGWEDTFDHPSADALALIVAIYEIGCFIGAIGTFIIGERIGRKRSIAVGAVWMAVGAILQTIPTKGHSPRGVMIAGRVISGIGMGFINSSAPVLQAEVSPAASRGRFVCAQLSMLNFGICITYWIDYGMTSRFKTATAFRIPIALQLVFIIPIFVLSFLVPESPRWLANHGRKAECHDVVARLAGLPQDNPQVLTRYNAIVDAVEFEKSIEATSFGELFANDALHSRRRLLIACSVQFFQQLGGINGIIYYAVFIFSNSLGFSSGEASLLSGGLFTWFFVASFIPWFLIDTIGRRKLLIGSVSLMAGIFAAMGGVLSQVGTTSVSAAACGKAAAFLAFLYMGAFTTGFQATVWVYPPEILPTKIRAKGTALATATNWIINFAVVYIMPISISNIGYKTYFIFFAFNASFVPVMYYFYPETKGRSLEEVDALFAQMSDRDLQEMPHTFEENKNKTHHVEHLQVDQDEKVVVSSP